MFDPVKIIFVQYHQHSRAHAQGCWSRGRHGRGSTLLTLYHAGQNCSSFENNDSRYSHLSFEMERKPGASRIKVWKRSENAARTSYLGFVIIMGFESQKRYEATHKISSSLSEHNHFIFWYLLWSPILRIASIFLPDLLHTKWVSINS